MKIGLLLPTTFAVANLGNGILAQARYQAAALEELGHSVVLLDSWNPAATAVVDVIHFLLGGYAMYGIEHEPRKVPLLFAPIIDSNQSNRSYRLAARLGSLHQRVNTIPAVFKAQAEASDVVIVRSEHEKTRVIEGLGINPAKVRKVLNGVLADVEAVNTSAANHLKLPEKFLLHVSTYSQARKNVLNLIEAVGPTGFPLVIAGDRDAGNLLPKVRQSASRFSNIRLLGFLTREELNALYSKAHAFCLPSMHEGTGLVALEAAMHDCGIMITRNGGPPDYFGKYAEYVDPLSVQSIQRSAIKLWDAAPMPDLREHITGKLTWANSARSLIEAYEYAQERYRASVQVS